MTHEEQQALFDTILRRANRPGSFNVENGIRLTSLSDGGAVGEAVSYTHLTLPTILRV